MAVNYFHAPTAITSISEEIRTWAIRLADEHQQSYGLKRAKVTTLEPIVDDSEAGTYNIDNGAPVTTSKKRKKSAKKNPHLLNYPCYGTTLTKDYVPVNNG